MTGSASRKGLKGLFRLTAEELGIYEAALDPALAEGYDKCWLFCDRTLIGNKCRYLTVAANSKSHNLFFASWFK